ncbi:hypothetical protein [Streptomyces sp. NPDC006552]
MSELERIPLANSGRLMPDGTAGLVIFLVAIAVIIGMIIYGRSTRKRRR